MKKLLCALLLVCSITFIGCTENQRAKVIGGTVTIKLEPGKKLEMLTWKDADLWIQTRDFRPEEFAETHYFQEKSKYGVFEGKIIIIEQEK